jgi:TDG/mug DNA glycosylase family protein
MRITRAELEAARDRSVPDLLSKNLRLLFVGINPGLWTAAAQAHFAKRGNRFYPALHLAGLTEREIDASGGLPFDDAVDLTSRGIGITNIVNRATARADELSTIEIRRGGAELAEKVSELRPSVVVVLGITAYRTAFNRPRAKGGWQPEGLGGAQLLVAGNPSGLNAHETVASLAASFREAADRAGIRPVGTRPIRTKGSSSADPRTASG